MADWQGLGPFTLPRVILHQHSGQEDSCLEGLVEYACMIYRNKHTYSFSSPEMILEWLLNQPVKLDTGDGPNVPGCTPKQRSRIWPDDGVNCWEATAHLLAVAFCNRWPIDFHVYDAKVGGQRHVFPAVAPLETNLIPIPLVIQPPIKTGKTSKSLNRAQAEWYNDLLGGLHFVGDKVLRVFGMGELSDSLAELEGDELPDWARTAKQKEQRAATLIKRAAEESKKAREEANKTANR